MLQYRTVQSGTLDVLKKLMSLAALKDFYLVGGTALSLYYGHRISEDLDIFSTSDFKNESILPVLEEQFPDFRYANPNNPVGIFGFIGMVKVDLVRHHYCHLIHPAVMEDGIRLMSIHDIMAMKVAAILKRGVKKDFWDIAEILDHYPINELTNCYSKKYPNQQLLISIPQALTYFEDAEESEEPVSLKGQTWESVKRRIQDKVRAYLW